MQERRSVSVFVQSHFFNLKQSRAVILANRNTECASLNHFVFKLDFNALMVLEVLYICSL